MCTLHSKDLRELDTYIRKRKEGREEIAWKSRDTRPLMWSSCSCRVPPSCSVPSSRDSPCLEHTRREARGLHRPPRETKQKTRYNRSRIPCIGFSLVGKREGYNNVESGLFDEILRLTYEFQIIFFC
jgi:hypothetical protein